MSQRGCVSKGLTRPVTGAPVILGEVLQREGVVLKISPLPQDRTLKHLTHPHSPTLRTEKEELDWDAICLRRALHSTYWWTQAGRWDEGRAPTEAARGLGHHTESAPRPMYFELLFSNAQNAKEISVHSTWASALQPDVKAPQVCAPGHPRILPDHHPK